MTEDPARQMRRTVREKVLQIAFDCDCGSSIDLRSMGWMREKRIVNGHAPSVPSFDWLGAAYVGPQTDPNTCIRQDPRPAAIPPTAVVLSMKCWARELRAQVRLGPFWDHSAHLWIWLLLLHLLCGVAQRRTGRRCQREAAGWCLPALLQNYRCLDARKRSSWFLVGAAAFASARLRRGFEPWAGGRSRIQAQGLASSFEMRLVAKPESGLVHLRSMAVPLPFSGDKVLRRSDLCPRSTHAPRHRCESGSGCWNAHSDWCLRRNDDEMLQLRETMFHSQEICLEKKAHDAHRFSDPRWPL